MEQTIRHGGFHAAAGAALTGGVAFRITKGKLIVVADDTGGYYSDIAKIVAGMVRVSAGNRDEDAGGIVFVDIDDIPPWAGMEGDLGCGQSVS